MSAVVEFGFSAPSVFAGVSALEKKLGGLNDRVNSMTGIDLGKMLPTAGALASVSGLRAILGGMDDLADASLRLNETTEVLQRVGHASEILAGVDIDGLSTSFLKLEKALGDVENKDAAKALADLNVTAEELIRMPLDQKMLTMADAFTTARDRGTGYNDILALLGKSAGDLIPLFEQGSGAIKDMMDGASVVSDASVQRLAAANDQLDTWFATLKVGATESMSAVMQLGGSLLDIGKGLWDGKSMQSIADEASSAQQAQLDARAAAEDKIAERRKKAAEAIGADTKAKAEADAAKETAKQADKIAEAQERLDEQKRKAGLDQMTLAKRIATISVEVKDAAAKEAAIRAQQTPVAQKLISAESKRVQLQSDLNALQKQYVADKDREAEAAKRTAEQVEREAEAAKKKASDRRESVLDTALEYKILQDKARGNERAVEEDERQLRVLQRARNLEANNGLNKKEALALALKMTDLEDRANGKGSKIHAPVDKSDPNMRNGLAPAWRSGPSGDKEYRGMGGFHGDPLTKNGGLGGFWDLQAGNIGMNSGMSDHYLQNAFSDGDSIQQHHAANAAAKAGAGNAGDNSLVDAFLDKLTSRLPPALAAAILAQS